MSSDSTSVTRRRLLIGGLGIAAAGLVVPPFYRVLRQARRRVAVLRAGSYDADLVDLLVRGIREFPDTVARAKGGRVFLKSNLVDYAVDRPINTDPRVVASAAEAFRRLGAAEVMVGDGPAHRRDTHLLVHESGLGELLEQVGVPFVDLNVDATREVVLPVNTSGLGSLHLPTSILDADLVVSMPKMKCHHWAGVTLSMKNLFGVVPGSVYGWPKNILHHVGISECVVDVWSVVKPGFAIVDGIVGMQGDGPLHGTAVDSGVLVLGEHAPAVDSVCTRLMGLREDRVAYLRNVIATGATVDPSRIENIGDQVDPIPFEVVEHYAHLRS